MVATRPTGVGARCINRNTFHQGNDFSGLALFDAEVAMENTPMKKILLIAVSAALFAGPALAQSKMTTTGTAPAEARFSTISKEEMFSSKLKGLNIYNQKDESIGEIADLAIKNNQVDAMILSVGGFLGMGEHYVAVSPASVKVRYDEKNNKWMATMNTTKEALKAAPEFKYPK
jgi:sporulation protein YlmC with PRC-barrel domain